ncbi:HET-domain-containing protein [Mytilinidion resinicola]|uniref:HET-domain-containing protein n=1 Tax=Mytilinidion resinicola TaxID=574789 RepID=A0A6A6YNW5_9PEZI|nr:HET-domain-containing protein [Mytilinidion resinicola]KAF2810470.1 HET-domain-containing protein [Mytilinidion resinicola]
MQYLSLNTIKGLWVVWIDLCLRLPQNIPDIISDAITAAKALGYKWLWVDKYCIDQNDPGDKHHQINQMDAIYAGADLTIVAALGDRLPGVGKTPRKRQPVVRIGNTAVVSSMGHPHETIRSSKWSTRGWTYQEAVLSLRCLVFTDEQLYFECRFRHFYEAKSHGYLGMISNEEWEAKTKLPQRTGLFSGGRDFTDL